MPRNMGILSVLIILIILVPGAPEVDAAPHPIHSDIFDMMDILRSNEGSFNEMLERLKMAVDYRKQRGCSIGEAVVLEKDMVNVVSKSFASVIRTLLMMQDLLQDVTGHFKKSPCTEEIISGSCSSDEWQCSSGQCISNELYCNGEVNCPDSSDESVNCSSESLSTPDSSCNESHFSCKSDGKCIAGWWRCDGTNDCPDGSDEQNCNVASCSPEQIACGSLGICIMRKWICDGDFDCLDGSDEIGCHQKGDGNAEPWSWSTLPGVDSTLSPYSIDIATYTENDTSTCRGSYFLCPTSGLCIPKHWRCDGAGDCPDDSDEKHCVTMETTDLPDVTTVPSAAAADVDDDSDDEDASSSSSKVTQSLSTGGADNSLLAPSNTGVCNNEGMLCKVKSRPICIPSDWICDGITDCDDKSDESSCSKKPLNIQQRLAKLLPLLSEKNTAEDPSSQEGNIIIKVKKPFKPTAGTRISPSETHPMMGRSAIAPGANSASQGPYDRSQLGRQVISATQNIFVSVNSVTPPGDHREDKESLVSAITAKIFQVLRSQDFYEALHKELPLEITNQTFSYIYNGDQGTLTPQYTEGHPGVSASSSAVSSIQKEVSELFRAALTSSNSSTLDLTHSRFNLTLRWRRSPCNRQQIYCSEEKKCIPKSWRCDGDSDCQDGEDEKDCPKKCNSRELTCQRSGDCLPKSWQCDGERDCPDGSDEEDCVHKRVIVPHVMFFVTANGTCREGWFFCETTNRELCIPERWLCDGVTDCLGETDERVCAASVPRVEEFRGRSAEKNSFSKFASTLTRPTESTNDLEESSSSPETLSGTVASVIAEFENAEDLESEGALGFDLDILTTSAGNVTTDGDIHSKTGLEEPRAYYPEQNVTLPDGTTSPSVTASISLNQRLDLYTTEQAFRAVTSPPLLTKLSYETTTKPVAAIKPLTTTGKTDTVIAAKAAIPLTTAKAVTKPTKATPAPITTTDKAATLASENPLLVKENCSGDQFYCPKDEKCVPLSWRCDGEKDCLHGQDERNCPQDGCDRKWWIKCSASENCINSNWLCDGIEDCPDGSDEKNCTISNPSTTSLSPPVTVRSNYTLPVLNGTCSTEFFKCIVTDRCIPVHWRCDGDEDCPNGEDEDGCPTVTGVTTSSSVPLSELLKKTSCSHGMFRCITTLECIPPHWLCDGENDCKDNTDESLCPFTKRSKGKPERPSSVTSPPEGPLQQGTPLASTVLSLLRTTYSSPTPDSRLAVTSVVSPTEPTSCLNDPAYFQCFNGLSCYEVSRVCDGQSDCSDNSDEGQGCEMQREGFLLVSLGRRLEAFSLDVRSSSRIHTQLHGNIVGVAYDPVYREVYWSVLSTSNGGVYRKVIGNSNEPPKLFIESSTKMEGLALDWLGRNLYIADSNNKRIRVCSIMTANCTTLIEDIALPRTLQLDLAERKIYWTDAETPLIEVAGMDGKQRATLVSEKLGWPNGLAVDLELRRIYWMDGRHDTVEYVHLDGSQRQEVTRTSSVYPYAVALWKEKIFWTDMLRKQVLTCTKWNCTDGRMFASTAPQMPAGMTVYHPSLFGKAENTCAGHSCSHLCLLSKSSPRGYLCACPDNMTLQNDQLTCV